MHNLDPLPVYNIEWHDVNMDCVEFWANRGLVKTEFNTRDLTRAVSPCAYNLPHGLWLLVFFRLLASMWIVKIASNLTDEGAVT